MKKALELSKSKNNEESESLLVNLVSNLLDLFVTNLAEQLITREISSNGKNGRILVLLAKLHLQKGDLEEAQSASQEMLGLSMNNHNPDAWAIAGDVHYLRSISLDKNVNDNRSHSREAIEAYSRADALYQGIVFIDLQIFTDL
jgi:hypothetical protein